MAEATLYMWTASGMFPAPDPSSRGGWRRNSDYARLLDRVAELDRERDELAAKLAECQCDRLGPETVECAQIVGEALRSIECPDDGPVPFHVGHLPDMCRDLVAELARLRAVEKAAKAMIEAGLADIDDAERAYDALAEALGATSAVDRECDRGRKG